MRLKFSNGEFGMSERKIIFIGGSAFSSIGGIQAVNRHLLKFLLNAKCLGRALFRMDDTSDVPARFRCEVSGFSGQRFSFILNTLKWALRYPKALLICDHLNYGPLAFFCGRGRYIVYVHALEVINPVSFVRRFCLRRAKRVICVSEFAADLVRGLGVEPERIVVIYHGEDFPQSEAIQSNSPHFPKVLFLGGMDRHYKGQDHLLQAARILVDRGVRFELKMLGGGEGLAQYQDQCRQLSLDSCVSLPGFVSDDEVDRQFADAAIFAMPSNGEGFGLVYLQAMANGLPCICCDGDAAKEVVVDQETGFVVPYANPERLADSLQHLIEDSELRQQMGVAGKARYEACFTEAAFERRFLKILV